LRWRWPICFFEGDNLKRNTKYFGNFFNQPPVFRKVRIARSTESARRQMALFSLYGKPSTGGSHFEVNAQDAGI
jgi:hypothetical protein